MGAATDEQAAKEPKPPFHIINTITGKFAGPFSTELDATFARNLAAPNSGWPSGEVLDMNAFDQYLEGKKQDRETH